MKLIRHRVAQEAKKATALGYVVHIHPRLKTVAINGRPGVSYGQALKELEELIYGS